MNAIIIMENIGWIDIKRHLVEKGSSYDLLFVTAFMKMGFKIDCHTSGPKSMLSFSVNESLVVGRFILQSTSKKKLHQKMS